MKVALQMLSWGFDLFASHKESGINQNKEDLGEIMFLMYRYRYLFIIGYDTHTSAGLCHHSNLTSIIKEQEILQTLQQYGVGDNTLTSE
jgi:hypothetical protein